VEDLARDFDTAWKQALEWFFEPFPAFFLPPRVLRYRLVARAGVQYAPGGSRN
jgi:hypothetical protein